MRPTIAVLGPIFILTSCTFSQQKYGGSVDASSTLYTRTAQSLISSSTNLLQIDVNNSVIYGTSPAIAKLTNLAPTRNSFSDPNDLTPGDAGLGVTNNGWIQVNPPTTSITFDSPLSNDIENSSFSVAGVVKTSSTGEIFRYHPNDLQNQAFDVRADSQYIYARFWSSPTDYYETQLAKPSNDTTVFVASFSADATQIGLSVNGDFSQSVTLTGSTLLPTQMSRIFSLGPSQTTSTILVKEIYGFSRELTKSEIGSLMYYIAQKNSIAITLAPAIAVPSGSTTTVDPNFSPAQAIIAQNCSVCHSSWANAKSSYYLNNSLVVKNSALTSKLYYRLTASAGSNGPKTMPQGSGALSASDLQKIQTWIDNIP